MSETKPAPEAIAASIDETLAAQEFADAAAGEEARTAALDDAGVIHTVQLTPEEIAAAEAARLDAEAKPVLEIAQLRALIAVIEAGNTTLQQVKMIEDLRANSGAVIETGDAATLVRLAGIEVSVRGGPTVALTTWCSKARRAILNGEAV